MKAQRPVPKPASKPADLPIIGLIGLGIMGHLMARSLRARGFEVWGHDPLPAMRRRCAKLGVKVPGSNAAVARQADLLITSLPSAAALHAVVAELEVAAGEAAGVGGQLSGQASDQPGGQSSDQARGPARSQPRRQLVVETSTLTLADKLTAARAFKRQGRQMLDAPISGTATPTPEQTWIMYLSGPVAACRQAAAVVDAFTLKAPRVGALGAGIKLKIAANHLVGLYNAAYGEMVGLCRAMGLDPQVALTHMAGSPYIGTGLMALRMPMMIRREYEPATMKIELWQKDMQVIGQTARAAMARTPLLDACAALYDTAMAQGRGLQDTAAVAEVLQGPVRP